MECSGESDTWSASSLWTAQKKGVRGIIICSVTRMKIGEVLGHLEAPSWWISEELLKEMTRKLRMGE